MSSAADDASSCCSDNFLYAKLDDLRRMATLTRTANQRESHPTVLDDDLGWLHGPLGERDLTFAATIREQMAIAQRVGTMARLEFTSIRNRALRRELKLSEMRSELRGLQQVATDTTKVKQLDAERWRAYEGAKERLRDMELAAMRAWDYSGTLELILDRIREDRAHEEDIVVTMRQQVKIKKRKAKAPIAREGERE
ncbi:MAG: hypothetical protein SGPRY_011609 [Prymnesium sp.]